jgi:RNA polymerase sigma-70 factor, ECF subfamily
MNAHNDTNTIAAQVFEDSVNIENGNPVEPPFARTLDESLYERLRRMASRYLKMEMPGHPFEPSDLVNEVMLRLASSRRPLHVETTEHLLALSALSMRRVLVDYARSTKWTKGVTISVTEDLAVERFSIGDAIAIRQGLEKLAKAQSGLYRIVELHVFNGYTFEEIGESLSISSRTAKRGWARALERLRDEL